MATGAATLVATAAAPAQHARKFDLLAPEFEVLDPNPDLHTLFAEYNAMFFDGKLAGCEVKWSSRMTLCAGLCSFQPRSGFCSIRLSEPLLKLRSRGDMINTLLHEMIHAYVFVFSPVKDHDDHGVVFQSHMRRINQIAGTHITVYHTFHDEVDSYRQHWWKCDGPCQRAPPYYGVVKRAMNRPPGPTDRWWDDHQKQCGGSYTKVRDPPGFKEKQAKKLAAAAKREQKKRDAATPSVKSFFSAVGDDASASTPTSASAPKTPPRGSGSKAGGASQSEEKPEPKTKKARIAAPTPSPSPPPPLSVASSTDSSAHPHPHLPTTQSVELPEFPVVFTTGDGELFLAGDLRALFQPSVRTNAPVTTSAATGEQVVDLTLSDDDDDTAQDSRADSNCPATVPVCADVIEIED